MFTDVPLTSQPVYGSLSVCVHLEQWIRSPVIFFLSDLYTSVALFDVSRAFFLFVCFW